MWYTTKREVNLKKLTAMEEKRVVAETEKT